MEENRTHSLKRRRGWRRNGQQQIEEQQREVEEGQRFLFPGLVLTF